MTMFLSRKEKMRTGGGNMIPRGVFTTERSYHPLSLREQAVNAVARGDEDCCYGNSPRRMHGRELGDPLPLDLIFR